MLFSYNWLKDFVPDLPKPEKLAELLTMHSFEVEEVKKLGKDYLLDIDVLPNRGPDCFSHIGIARECAALLNSKLKTQNSKPQLKIQNLKTSDFISVEVKNREACPRYTARVISDVKVKQSPKWLQERLKVCGLRPINNIVDAVNYVMLETGQPLHAFDFEKIESVNPKSQAPNSKPQRRINSLRGRQIPNSKFQIPKKIIVRRAKKGEKIITLDNKKYNLDKDVLIIADEKGPLAIAGIKGGKRAETDKKTKTVVLESANFNSRVIRQGSQKLGLKTDASWRFEHGIDPNLTEIAINRVAKLIEGKVASGIIDFYPKEVRPKKIKLDLNYLEKLLGIKISEKEVRKILESLGLKIENCKLKILNVVIPTFRLDISLPEDLIEEIGRFYGYQKIPANFPVVSLIPPKRNLEIFWEDTTKNILKELGFTEVYNYSFISEKEAKIFGYRKGEVIEIENPMSKEQKYLRPSLIPNLLKNLADNLRYFKEIKTFELGKIFKKIKNQKGTSSLQARAKIKNTNQKLKVAEKQVLAGLITGDAFYQLKGTVDSLLNKLGISDVWYNEYQQTPEESKKIIWEPKKSAEIKIDGQEEIGFLGEVSPKILRELKIKGKVILFDIDFKKLTKLCSEEHEYQPISQYPAAIRDLAVLVPLDVKVIDVLNRINAAGGPLIRDVDLFDIYEGEELPEGKKNLAFHIIYQAEDRTLISREIDRIHNKIVKTLEKDPTWQVRR